MTEAAKKPTGYVQRIGSMTAAQKAAIQKALSGNDPNATVVIPAENLRAGLVISIASNGLKGVFLNEEGDGI